MFLKELAFKGLLLGFPVDFRICGIASDCTSMGVVQAKVSLLLLADPYTACTMHARHCADYAVDPGPAHQL